MSIKSVLTDVKSRLDGLLSFANETTGAGDVSLGDAVLTLANGYGGGGVNSFVYTVNEAIPTSEDGSTITIPHDLGIAPSFVEISYIGQYFDTTHIIFAQGTLEANKIGTSQGNGGIFFSNAKVDKNPVYSPSAIFVRADNENIYVSTGSWAGRIEAGSRFLVYLE